MSVIHKLMAFPRKKRSFAVETTARGEKFRRHDPLYLA